jgi:hypothetical protein
MAHQTGSCPQPGPRRQHASRSARLTRGRLGYGRSVTYGRDIDEPIGDQVPVEDAVQQRLPVSETRELSEDFQPTELDEIAVQDEAPDDANLADWQEQRTSADIPDEWDGDEP